MKLSLFSLLASALFGLYASAAHADTSHDIMHLAPLDTVPIASHNDGAVPDTRALESEVTFTLYEKVTLNNVPGPMSGEDLDCFIALFIDIHNEVETADDGITLTSGHLTGAEDTGNLRGRRLLPWQGVFDWFGCNRCRRELDTAAIDENFEESLIAALQEGCSEYFANVTSIEIELLDDDFDASEESDSDSSEESDSDSSGAEESDESGSD